MLALQDRADLQLRCWPAAVQGPVAAASPPNGGDFAQAPAAIPP